MSSPIHIVGAGLAGCEAAWQIAQMNVPVVLHEMRPARMTPAHRTQTLAELVCSNSFRSDDANANAVGVLHREMRAANSLIFQAADSNQVPAGGALAVDREGFARDVQQAVESHALITLAREEVFAPEQDWDSVIVATGPLTAPALSGWIAQHTGAQGLAFFDAIAPIVHRDSIDMNIAWMQSRYDKAGPGGTGADYINCPLDRDQYEAFIDALLAGEKTEFHDWELRTADGKATPYFDGCLPIEVMAERGRETLRHGPMKPVGLTNAHNPTVKAYAVVQLRQDNKIGALYNIVGFQTKLKHGAQAQIFRMIPGLEKAEFARLGGVHRNSYLNSPMLLDEFLRLKTEPRLRFAGQITGCEGYVESAAIGLLAGRMAGAERLGSALSPPPATTALGALARHIIGGHVVTIDAGPRSFQPMNVNFGLFEPLEAPVRADGGKKLRGPEKALAKKHALSQRAEKDFCAWLEHAKTTLGHFGQSSS